MVIIHGKGEFTADEVRAYRQQIYQNVISAMRVLLDARQKLGFAWQNPERQKHVEAVMRFTATDMMRGIDQPTFAEIAPLIRDLWDDQAIKHTYDQRNLFQIVSPLFECVFLLRS
uniref:Guanine nucleotide-binding protein alpha-12 subunit n=1 Tax=Ascaris suum TaxID=6253 RepID=F1LEH2_ASCSU